MRKSIYWNLQVIVVAAVFCAGLASCGDEDESVITPQTEQNDGKQQTENISNQDPEGTVVLNMNNGAKNNYYDLGFGESYKIHIDEANNFIGESHYVVNPIYGSGSNEIFTEIVTIGSVRGLSEVNTIPTTGWSESAAVVPRTGYVVRVKNQSYSYDMYARLYVVDYIVGTSGGIIGATIKYQSPFARTIKLEKTSLTFTSAASSQNITLTDATAYYVSKKPAWCTVSSNTNPVTISVVENLAMQQSGRIVLKNAASTAEIEIVQQGASSPLFECGHGTASDPYQIKTAQQLQNINVRPDLYYTLISDIDMTSYLNTTSNGWNPIGTPGKPFTGTFDGNNHVISGIWIDRPMSNNVGLFGITSEATIKNIALKTNSNGIKGSTDVGGICGYLSGSISNCSVDGTISGNDYVGGICGGATYTIAYSNLPNGGGSWRTNSLISSCITSGVIISSGFYCGQILGGNHEGYNCIPTDCSSTATLKND